MDPIDDEYLGLNMHKRETSKSKPMTPGPGIPETVKGGRMRNVGKTRPSRMGSMALVSGRTKTNSKPKYVGHFPNLDKLVRKMK
jgi:hypothetical protein